MNYIKELKKMMFWAIVLILCYPLIYLLNKEIFYTYIDFRINAIYFMLLLTLGIFLIILIVEFTDNKKLVKEDIFICFIYSVIFVEGIFTSIATAGTVREYIESLF